MIDKLKKRTIARDLTLGITLTIIAVTVSISLLNYTYSVSKAEQRLNKQANDLVGKLSPVLDLPLWNIDLKAVKFVAEAYLQTENLAALCIRDESGVVLYEKSASNEKDLIHASRPISHLSQPIGLIEIALSKRNLLDNQRRSLWLTLAIMICVIVSVILVTIILLRVFLNKPINTLTQGIETIARGSYDYLLPPVKQHDVNMIVQKVNDMAGQISERDKALRESKARYEDLANLLPEMVYETDEEGFFTFLNRSGFESLGYTHRDLEQGLNSIQLFPAELQERIQNDVRRILDGEALGAIEYTARRKNQTTFPVLVHAKPIVRAGKTVGLRSIAVDITDRKRIEEELAKLATGVAHQVRNPVMTIGGFARRLQKRFPSDAPPQEWLKIILSEVRRLEKMVKDIHRHTSLPPPDLRPAALSTVVENVMAECAEDLDSPDLRIEQHFSEETPQVLIDEHLFGLALANILTNARQAMPEGGVLTVSIAAEENRVCLCIRDTGLGIAPEDLPYIFDPFFSSDPQASGLGLTTAHRIISDHKAEIRIHSTPGRGTDVKIWFPPASQ